MSDSDSARSTTWRLKRPSGVLIAQMALLAAILGSWQAVASLPGVEFWTSSPLAIAHNLSRWHASGELVEDLKITLFEAGAGFLLGSLFGGIVGFVLGWVRKLGDVFEPFVLSLYTLPKVALAPLFVLWLGIGVLNKVVFSGVLVFFMVFFTTYQGARQVDRDLVENVRLLGASRVQTWTKVAVPYSAVWIFTGLRVGLPYALIGAIVGEFVAAESGVGFRIKEATSFFNTSGVFAGLFVLMLISMSLLGVLRLVENRLMSWQTAVVDVQPSEH